MRKAEIAEIVVIIHRQKEPEKLLGEFVEMFQSYAPLFRKFYKSYLRDIARTTNILKRVYGKGIIKTFREEGEIFSRLSK